MPDFFLIKTFIWAEAMNLRANRLSFAINKSFTMQGYEPATYLDRQIEEGGFESKKVNISIWFQTHDRCF